MNNYQYAPNPTGWVDPLGLSCKENHVEIPDNYDFLDDRFFDPISQEQLNHNIARDIEDLLDEEKNNFFLKDPQLSKNSRIIYEASTVKDVIDYHEFLSVRAYTDDFYNGINPALRSGSPGKWSQIAESADSGLAKLSASEDFGYGSTLTRGMNIEGSEAEIDSLVHQLFPDDNQFSDTSFMSTSYDASKSFKGNIQIEIETSSKHAKIDGISVYDKAEAEVLVRPNQKFDVVSK